MRKVLRKQEKKRLRKYGAGQIVQEFPHKKTLILWLYYGGCIAGENRDWLCWKTRQGRNHCVSRLHKHCAREKSKNRWLAHALVDHLMASLRGVNAPGNLRTFSGSATRVNLIEPSVVHTFSMRSSSLSSFILARVAAVRSSTMMGMGPPSSLREARTSLLQRKMAVRKALSENLMRRGAG